MKPSGILKQRYSDFIVHEIDTNGVVVQLASEEPPVDIAAQSSAATETVRPASFLINLFC